MAEKELEKASSLTQAVLFGPVRACLAKRPEEYRWSSAAAHLGEPDRSKVLDLDYWEEEGGKDRWEVLLAEPEDVISLRLLRRCTYAGRPFGDDTFVKSLEERFGRTWRRWSFEATVFPGKFAAT